MFFINSCVVDDGFELLTDGDDGINEAVNQQLDVIWMLIHRCITRDLCTQFIFKKMTILK